MARRQRLIGLTRLALGVVAVAAVLAVALGQLADGGSLGEGGGGDSGVATASAAPPAGSFEPSSPAPVRLAGARPLPGDWPRPPAAAVVFDVDSGEALYRRRAHATRSIASLTKIMTALAVTAATRPDDVVRISPRLRYEGSAIGLLPRGRRVPLEPLLGGLMIVSGNDAALALAEHVSGSVPAFVAAMNERARLWGLRCTRFASPHGLADGDRSCAADLAVMTRLALRDRRIARVARAPSAVYRFPIKGRKLYLTGHNPLIRAGYPGAIGLKTGYTDAAGSCFVAVARRNGRTLAVVLLDSPNIERQAARLLDRAFAAS